ncbi:MAG: hypothetical protein LBU87_00515 [Lactobacillales bacterium]|jgi:hypothetical protein|nr:hypothetical protein [Lactobacillales bacterium]
MSQNITVVDIPSSKSYTRIPVPRDAHIFIYKAIEKGDREYLSSCFRYYQMGDPEIQRRFRPVVERCKYPAVQHMFADVWGAERVIAAEGHLGGVGASQVRGIE